MEEIAGTALEDDEGVNDAATERQRRFEDWKDGVPNGVGSTKLV